MRKLVVVVAAVTCVFCQGTIAFAQDVPDRPVTDYPAFWLKPILRVCQDSTQGDAADCGDEYIVDIDDIVSPATDVDTSTDEPVRYIAYHYLDLSGGPNGESCAATGYRPVESALEAVPTGQRAGEISSDVAAHFPACPVAPAGDEMAPETPRTYAVRYWQHIPLPVPQPYIAPGRAITGLLAYLETRGTTTHSFTEPNTPFGPLTIVATGRYYVDWGDGTHTGPHSGEGQPWPDGDITHLYIHIGAYDVVVTERWTATWSFGSASGTLGELRTVGRIEDFPVQQIQAVVIR